MSTLEQDPTKDTAFKPKKQGDKSLWEHLPMIGGSLYAAHTGEEFVQWAMRLTSNLTSIDAAKFDSIKSAYLALGQAAKNTASKDLNLRRLVHAGDLAAYEANAGG